MAEVINQTLIPKIKLSSGEEIPCVGMGTFGSDRFTAEQVSNAVAGAIRCGYRMFDCAACYQNEDQIGEVFKAAFDEGVVERKDLYHDKGMERYAQRSRKSLQKEHPGSSVRLCGPVLYPLAIPKLSCTGMRRRFQKS